MTHEIRLTRYQRGKSIPSNHMLYGWRVKCLCGFTERVNGTKREAERVAKDHERESGR